MAVTWANPLKQHDVAEFLLFMGQCQWFVREVVAMPWQARYCDAEDRVQTADAEESLPLLLMPPPGCAVANDVDTSVTVQELVDQWQEQDCRHAMLMAPAAIVLQAARFCYDTEFDRATKRRYRVVPSRYLDVPTFCDGLRVRPILYQLNSVCRERSLRWPLSGTSL